MGTWAVSCTRLGPPCPGSFFTTEGSKGGVGDSGKLRELELRQVQSLQPQGSALGGGMSWIFGSPGSKGCVADMPSLSLDSTTDHSVTLGRSLHLLRPQVGLVGG